jgi:CubicO group peptidase (beta-lactamase class C family)
MHILQSLDPALIGSAGVPGLSMAVIRKGELEHILYLGVRDNRTKVPVNAETVFEAASLSKPLVAFAALQLVDAGKLNIDEPLSRIVPILVPAESRSSSITARHVLAHTTGLPNWRREEYPLRTYFSPGSRFSYSGEGFVYLQSAIERLLDEPLENVMKQLVFEPLRMDRSSYVWQAPFEENFAASHDEHGHVGDKFRPTSANAAYSLHSTASDYARFLVAAMSGARLSKPTHREWLRPQVRVPAGRSEALDSDPPETHRAVAWGLGWGLEPARKAFFHWGANPGASAFAIGVPAERSALVLFANSDNGLGIVPRLLHAFLPGEHPALSWLGLT